MQLLNWYPAHREEDIVSADRGLPGRPSKPLLILFLGLPLFFLAAASAAQEAKSPVPHDSAAIERGRSLFRGDCAECHGIDARGGGRGPDLRSGRLAGQSDSAVFLTITKGIPGTAMSGYDYYQADEVWMIIAWLRSQGGDSGAPVSGSAEAGQRIFLGAGACARCHMAHGRGGRLGPDLSRIGSARSARYLAESIRDPNREIASGYETVTAITKRGRRITGVRRNEDTFSVQLMDEQERFRFFLKKDLRQVIALRTSLMPAYDGRTLSDEDLEDLVAYLASLRGP